MLRRRRREVLGGELFLPHLAGLGGKLFRFSRLGGVLLGLVSLGRERFGVERPALETGFLAKVKLRGRRLGKRQRRNQQSNQNKPLHGAKSSP